MRNAVGPILRMSGDVDAIVAAIEDDNPDTDVEVTDQGAYVRIMGDGRLHVTLESIQRYAGRDFEMRELEGMMPAFAGRIDTKSDEIIWEYRLALEPEPVVTGN
jgi:toluene monooxygenase system protein D